VSLQSPPSDPLSSAFHIFTSIVAIVSLTIKRHARSRFFLNENLSETFNESFDQVVLLRSDLCIQRYPRRSPATKQTKKPKFQKSASTSLTSTPTLPTLIQDCSVCLIDNYAHLIR
jgi:hypothetical protein